MQIAKATVNLKLLSARKTPLSSSKQPLNYQLHYELSPASGASALGPLHARWGKEDSVAFANVMDKYQKKDTFDVTFSTNFASQDRGRAKEARSVGRREDRTYRNFWDCPWKYCSWIEGKTIHSLTEHKVV